MIKSVSVQNIALIDRLELELGANLNILSGETGAGKSIVIDAIGAVIGQVGDLSFSIIKRQTGIKDYSHIFPGHGGVLDRFDSVIFTAPIIYYLALFL